MNLLVYAPKMQILRGFVLSITSHIFEVDEDVDMSIACNASSFPIEVLFLEISRVEDLDSPQSHTLTSSTNCASDGATFNALTFFFKYAPLAFFCLSTLVGSLDCSKSRLSFA